MRQFRRVWLTPIAPLFAILIVALSAYGGAAASTVDLQGSVDLHHAALLDAKPCQRIDAHQPPHKKCSGVAASSPAARRSRPDQPEHGGGAPAIPVTNLHADAPALALRLVLVRPPPRPGVRAPFWSTFAATQQLRN